MKTLSIITLKKTNINDFASARNELLKKSKTDWMLFVDSDEILSSQLHNEILNRIQDNNYNGFYVYRKNYFLGEYAGTDKILRLGRRGRGEWRRAVHEVWNLKGRIGELKHPLIHNTANNLHEFINKINYYSSLHAKENIKEGKRSGILKIIFYPPLKFVQSILMGRGFVMSMLQSFHSFLSWSKQYLNE